MISLWVGLALAQGLTQRVSRDPLPAREVERPLVLPKGWSEVAVSVGRTRWGEVAYRPFRGGVERREGALSARVSVGPTVELRASVPYVDLTTGTVLGGGLGSTTVGAGWLLARGEAPARSAALCVAWTTPSPHMRLPLGSPGHQLVPWLQLRQQVGGLRVTTDLGVRLAPARRVPWLRDALGRDQRVDLGEAARARVEALMQAGPLVGAVVVEGAFVGPDRVDEVVVTAPGPTLQVRQRGAVQWSRGLTTGIEGWQPVMGRAPLLAPALDPLIMGRGLGMYAAISL